MAGLGDNPEYHQDKLRLDYESMVTPDTVYDYDLATGTLETLKVCRKSHRVTMRRNM